jgi:hypothetical protein
MEARALWRWHLRLFAFVLPQLMTLKDPNGRTSGFRPAAGQPATLLGRRRSRTTATRSLGTLGDLWCADLSAIPDQGRLRPLRRGVRARPVPAEQDDDQDLLERRRRAVAHPADQLENGDIVSPFVALDVPGA